MWTVYTLREDCGQCRQAPGLGQREEVLTAPAEPDMCHLLAGFALSGTPAYNAAIMAGQLIKRGDRKWLVRIYMGRDPQTGKRQYFSRTVNGNKKDAERYLSAALRDRDLGIFAEPSKVALTELFDDLLRDYRTNHKSAWWAEICVEKHLRPFYGNVRAAQLTSNLINRYIEEKHTAGLAHATINRHLALLRRSLTLGSRATPPKVLNALFIPKLTENKPRSGFFEHDEFVAMRQELPGYLRPVLTFGYYTGCRKGEILALKLVQVDLGERLVRLNPGETKNDEARTVPLDGELYETLAFQRQLRDERYPSCPWVFFRDGECISKDFREAWEQAAKAAATRDENPVRSLWNFENERPAKLFHDLRRTGIRNLVRAGVSERVAMLISGHKSRSVFDRYNIVSERDIRDAGRKLTEYLLRKDADDSAHQNQSSHTIRTLKTKHQAKQRDGNPRKLLN